MRRRVSPLDAAFSLVADPILGDPGIAARLAVDALRLLGFLGWFVAQTGTHELLTLRHRSCLSPAHLQSVILCC